MTLDMSQFYQVFFEEAGEHLQNMESLLLALDLDHPSLDDLNAIFRAAHSIKGGSGTFGFTDMTEVTHVLETLLDRLRKGELAPTGEMVDAFLSAGDVLRTQLEHHQGGPAAEPGVVADICERLAALAAGEPAAPAPPAPEVRRLRLECALAPEVAGNAQGVDNLLAALAEIAAVELEHRPEAADPRLAAVLTTGKDDAGLREAFEFYASPDEIRLMPAEAAAIEDAGYGLFEELPGTAAAEAEQGYGLFEELPPRTPEPAPSETAGFGSGSALAESSGLGSGMTPAARASASTETEGFSSGVTPAVQALASSGPSGFGFFDDAPGAPAQAPAAAIEGEGYSSGVTPASAFAGTEGFGIFAGAPGSQGPAPAAPPAAPLAGTAGRRASDTPGVETVRAGRRETDKTATAAAAESSIRVSVEKVDSLINLVGELVITQAMLAQSAQDLDPVAAEKLLAGIELLSRNTRDLQESVMSIRMLPMSMVFNRFPRVVRDLAGKLGKQVELKTVGEATELDKGLIEKISDPLTHLVRNSLDHGIETPERRIAAGKDPKGAITLKASHQGGNIVIEVMDDGAGLNRDKILAKARERGLPVSEAMSDFEVWQLIFAPGFSTADEVTDVSGRGVGMDVVKKNIEGLGGKVELASATGFGTRTIISLPLTLAILDGMSVGVGGETYIVPLTLVVESLQPRPEDIRTIAGEGRVVAIRGEYLPLIPLGEVFGLASAVREPSRGILMVIEAEGGRAALFVDELLGQHQVVIKSLETNYRRVPGVSGATIMGDGRVALILDIGAVTRMGLQTNRKQYGQTPPGLAAALPPGQRGTACAFGT